jgi:hypothetical protein
MSSAPRRSNIQLYYNNVTLSYLNSPNAPQISTLAQITLTPLFAAYLNHNVVFNPTLQFSPTLIIIEPC